MTKPSDVPFAPPGDSHLAGRMDVLPDAWATRHGARTALVAGATRLTYIDLQQRVQALAAGFHRLGWRRGDHVIVQLPNTAGFVTGLLALIRIGALPVMTLPGQRSGDLDAVFRAACPVGWLAHGPAGVIQAQAIAARHPGPCRIVADGIGPATDAGGVPTLDALALPPADADTLPPPAAQPGDIALLLLSGGTTGAPKLIPRTHGDYVYNFDASARLCGFDESTVYLAVLPAAHNFVLGCPGVLGTFAVGGTVVMTQQAGCDEAMPLIARERVTDLALVPPLARLWAEARDWEDSDLSSLRRLQVGGARLDPALARTLPDRLGCPLQQVYGMAEGLLCYTRPDDPDEIVFACQGRPLSSDDELRVVDAEGQPVPDGAPGELLVRGPYTIRAYYRASADSARAFTPDGFFRTGDLVRRRADGNVVVTGRVKEQIQRAGKKVSAAVVEAALCACPGVRDAAVAAVPDALLGERITAWLQGEPGAPGSACPDAKALRATLLAAGLPAHQLPDQVLWTDHWPLTAAGKIDKRRLVQSVLDADCTDGIDGDDGDGGEPLRYHTCELPLHAAPLHLAARMARDAPDDTLAIYERNGEWSIGMGAAMTVTVAGDGAVTGHDGRPVPGPDTCAGIAAALGALPLADWRAYGRVDFALARVLQGMPQAARRPLAWLFVPAREIRLLQGRAQLRCLDPADLPRLQTWLLDLDRIVAARPMPEGAPLLVPADAGDGNTYRAAVASVLAEIRAGRYEKVILSRRVPVPAATDFPLSYLAGRLANTPARSFLWRDPACEAYGFSPETVVEVDPDGRVSTQPLAGTRALTGEPVTDARLRQALLTDPKEIAEHAVSVALALDELRTACDETALRIDEFMVVRARGSVQHLASRLHGQLAAGKSPWAAFAALFPAVTASGIPKRAAVASIMRHEPAPRGLYSGCVLTADADGRLDAALVLRSVFRQDDACWMQAGAGIVRDSTPNREWEETCEKLACVARYLRSAAP